MVQSTALERNLVDMDEKYAEIQQKAHWRPEEKVRHEVTTRINAKKEKIQSSILEVSTFSYFELCSVSIDRMC